MIWEKKGLIFKKHQSFDWNVSHTQCPTVDVIVPDGSIVDIYFSSRDSFGISRIGKVRANLQTKEVLEEFDNPVLSPGQLGCFDDSGVMSASIIQWKQQKYLFYIGWMRRQSVPYQNGIGLAQIDNSGKVTRVYEGPLFPPFKNEPFFTGTICIYPVNEVLHGCYLSCTGWKNISGSMEPIYNLKLATSLDCENWNRNGQVAIELKNSEEGGLANATVVEHKGKFYMWFCYRSSQDYRSNRLNSYRIGFAISSNGVNWIRRDDLAGIATGTEGEWDHQMICYPHVVKLKDKIVLLYNGNNFGNNGIGIAEMTFKDLEGLDDETTAE